MTISELRHFLAQPRSIVIVTHTRPDGDAIGSSLALCLLLRYMGHTSTVLLPTPAPTGFGFLPLSRDMICYEEQPNNALEALAIAEIIFILDLNDYKRLEGLCDAVANNPAPKVLIDHHLYPVIKPDFALCETAVSSTAELVYRFMGMIDQLDALNLPIALCLYTGIATDTGRFKYNTQAATLATVSELMRGGLDIELANQQIFDQQSEKQVRLLGFCLSQRMTLLPQYKAAYIALSRQDLQQFGFENGDLEGVVNFPLSIGSIEVVALFAEREDKIRISLRSKGDFSVNDIARQYFNGGGHRNAAGGSSALNMTETIDAFIKAIHNAVINE